MTENKKDIEKEDLISSIQLKDEVQHYFDDFMKLVNIDWEKEFIVKKVLGFKEEEGKGKERLLSKRL